MPSSTNRMIVALRANRRQRGEQDGQRRHQRPDIGNEAAGKDQDGQGSRQRDAEEDEQDEADDRPDASQDPGAAQIPTNAVDCVPAGGLDMCPMPVVRRLHDAAPQAVAIRQDVVSQEERQDGDGHRAGDVPGHAGELAGDPPAGRGESVLDGGCCSRRQLGVLEARLEALLAPLLSSVAIWPA